MEQFLKELAEILDVDEVSLQDVLEDFDEYDSLSVLSIISLAGTKYNKILTAKDVRACATVNDLFLLIEAK